MLWRQAVAHGGTGGFQRRGQDPYGRQASRRGAKAPRHDVRAEAGSSQEIERAFATYVDKIFRGAKPSDLPVEQPTRFELVINEKTAKLLGLKVTLELLLQADKVIE